MDYQDVYCADKLASVFTDVFNLSLSESVIPKCFKQTTIVPVPKNTNVTPVSSHVITWYFLYIAMLLPGTSCI